VTFPRSSNQLWVATLLSLSLWVTSADCVFAQANVLIFSSGDPQKDVALQSLLEAYGHKVIVGEEYPSYVGGGLKGIDVVVLQANPERLGDDMPLSGQDELLSFVEKGGGLITNDLGVWKGRSGQEFSALRNALPIAEAMEPDRSNATVKYTQSTLDATLNAGLPGSFSLSTQEITGSEMIYVPRPGATVFFECDEDQSGAGGGVIGWQYGAGRVLTLPTLLVESSRDKADFSMLVNNSVRWSASVPEPSAGVLSLLAVTTFGLYRRRWKMAARSSR
jgi:hypothetical protein